MTNEEVHKELFDRVSGQFFGNAGTGAFIVGPDKQTITANLGVLAPLKEEASITHG